MHDLLQDMGKEISKYSRLWHYDDICNVLRKHKVNEEVQGIFLDLCTIGDKRLNLHDLAKMPNLRLFKVDDSYVNDNYQNRLLDFEELEDFSTELKYFSWDGYPMKSLPSNFCAENLVRFEMQSSKIQQLWNGIQDLRNLKYINLTHSMHLTDMADLSKAINLEKLILSYCQCLTNFPGVVHSKYISLYGCSKLEVAPDISGRVEELILIGTAIKELPFIEHYQSKLVALDLSLRERLRNLSDIHIYECTVLRKVFFMPKKNLKLRGGFGDLGDFETSSSNLSSLKHLDLSYLEFVTALLIPPVLFSSVQVLSLTGSSFRRMPESIKDLSNLHILVISECKELRLLPELPRGLNVEAFNCFSLESVDPSFLFSHASRPQRVNFSLCFKLNLWKILLKESPRKICDGVCYPGNEIPKWFKFQNRGSTIMLKDPPDWSNKNFLGFNMGVAVAFPEGRLRDGRDYKVSCYCHMKSNDGGIRVYRYALRGWLNDAESHHYQLIGVQYLLFGFMSNHVILGFANSTDSPVNERDPIRNKHKYEMRNNEVLIEFDAHGYEVEECGVHLLYAQDCEEPKD